MGKDDPTSGFQKLLAIHQCRVHFQKFQRTWHFQIGALSLAMGTTGISLVEFWHNHVQHFCWYSPFKNDFSIPSFNLGVSIIHYFLIHPCKFIIHRTLHQCLFHLSSWLTLTNDRQGRGILQQQVWVEPGLEIAALSGLRRQTRGSAFLSSG